MQIERVDFGPCTGYVYPGDASRAAAVLPGAMLGGMPASIRPGSRIAVRAGSPSYS